MKNLEIRKIKNDRTDAKRIAQLYLFKMLRGNAVDSILVGALKDLTRQRSDIISERVKFSNKLTALLDQGFPGFRKVFPACVQSLPWLFLPASLGRRRYAAQTALILQKPLHLRLEEIQNPPMQ